MHASTLRRKKMKAAKSNTSGRTLVWPPWMRQEKQSPLKIHTWYISITMYCCCELELPIEVHLKHRRQRVNKPLNETNEQTSRARKFMTKGTGHNTTRVARALRLVRARLHGNHASQCHGRTAPRITPLLTFSPSSGPHCTYGSTRSSTISVRRMFLAICPFSCCS